MLQFVNNLVYLVYTYPLNKDLWDGKCYPVFEQPGPGHRISHDMTVKDNVSNCTILTVSPPINAIGEKKPGKNSGLQRDSNR